MMAAYAAASKGVSVTILEKNEKAGKKLFITGKGRCNVTNDCEPETFFENVISNPKFLYSAFYTFDNFAVMNLMEENGCKLKTERGNRVFPVSDHSSDIIKVLLELLKKHGVKILYHTTVKTLHLKENEINHEMIADGVILSDGRVIKADYVVLATGGNSYPLTGSTGDGYRMAEETGHRMQEIKPALVPFLTKEEWCMSLQGLALKNVTLTMKDRGKTIYHEFGEMLFTHFGISGPLVLSASSLYVKKNYGKEVSLFLDLKPALTEEQLDKRLLRDFEENKNRQFKNALDGLFPSRLIPVMVELSGILAEKPVHEITREERKKFVSLIKNLPMTVTGVRDFKEAIITQGGVSVKDINPSTMESKKVKALYFAGEIMDVDALTGGFNLQIAWSSGFLAGSSIAQATEYEE